MPLDPKIFKAYDIRGLCPGELDADAAFRIGQAVVGRTGARTVVVGRDMRGTSPMLFEALARGINSQGADVIDIGQVTTPVLYFAVAEYDLHDAGVMITASHNPKEYNGLKLCFGDAMPIGRDTGMNDIRDLALRGPLPAQGEGRIVQTDVRPEYVAKLLASVDVARIKPLKVAVDGGNGMAGSVIGQVFAGLPCTMDAMFLEPDGDFPNHEANPLNEETLHALQERIRATGAHLGFAYDGDADRLGVVDELGDTVPGDLVAALLVPFVLERHPGANILVPVNAGLALVEEIERVGGRAIMTQVGHGLIKPRMKRENAAFAGEIAYHYYFEDFYGADSPDYAMLLLLTLLSETGKPLSELVAPLRRYVPSGEVNAKIADRDAVMKALDDKYAAHASSVERMDGVRFDFSDPADRWWFNVRPSNTEPLLRLTLEAATRELMETRREQLLAIIRGEV